MWAQFKNLDDVAKISAFVLLLTPQAAIWFHASELSTESTWTQVKAEFLQRFSKYGRQTYLDRSKLWSMKQTTESPMEFITSVQSLAKIIGAPDADIVDVIMTGLKPVVRNFLVTKQVTTLPDLIYYSRLAEDLVPISDSPNAEMLDALKQINSRLDRLDMTRTISPVANDSRAKHVSFNDEVDQYHSDPYLQGQDYDQNENSEPGEQPPFNRSTYSNSTRPSRVDQAPRFQQYSRSPMRPNQNYQSRQPPSRFRPSSQPNLNMRRSSSGGPSDEPSCICFC